MPEMTDPTNALISFQEAFLDGKIQLQRGDVHPDIYVHFDQPNGKARFTYAKLDGQEVTALVLFALGDPIEDIPCFDLGYAVPEKHRGKGIAKATVEAAIEELAHGLSRVPIPSIYVQAVIGLENLASQRVAAHAISSEAEQITDAVSGQPALHYRRKVG